MSLWVLGADLGATKTEIGLICPQNRIVARRRILTRQQEGCATVASRIAAVAQQLVAAAPAPVMVAAMGICSPGPLNHCTGTLIDPPNLPGLHGAPLARTLADLLDRPVALEHDAKAAALGEFRYGAGRGARHMVFVVAGTGMGAAIIVDGALYHGPFFGGGEIGHAPFDRNGDLCSCGNRGCFETHVTGPWLGRRYQRRLPPGHAGKKLPVSGEEVARLAAAGDEEARAVLGEAGQALGIAVATLAMVFDVDLYVIGGSVANAGAFVLDPARAEAPRHVYPSLAQRIRIVRTELGVDGALLGCAALARGAV